MYVNVPGVGRPAWPAEKPVRGSPDSVFGGPGRSTETSFDLPTFLVSQGSFRVRALTQTRITQPGRSPLTGSTKQHGCLFANPISLCSSSHTANPGSRTTVTPQYPFWVRRPSSIDPPSTLVRAGLYTLPALMSRATFGHHRGLSSCGEGGGGRRWSSISGGR